MDPVAVVFLVVGGLGVLVLLASLVVGEIGDLIGGDADGPFSLPALAALVGGTGFGGAAAVALLPELPGPLTVLLAGLAGLVLAVPLALGVVRFSSALQHMPTDATLTRGHLLGAVGTVVSAIPTDGLGEVRVTLAGQQLKYYARSEVPLRAGTGVYVVDTPTETTVQVVSTDPDPDPLVPPPPGGPSS